MSLPLTTWFTRVLPRLCSLQDDCRVTHQLQHLLSTCLPFLPWYWKAISWQALCFHFFQSTQFCMVIPHYQLLQIFCFSLFCFSSSSLFPSPLLPTPPPSPLTFLFLFSFHSSFSSVLFLSMLLLSSTSSCLTSFISLFLPCWASFLIVALPLSRPWVSGKFSSESPCLTVRKPPVPSWKLCQDNMNVGLLSPSDAVLVNLHGHTLDQEEYHLWLV